MEAINSTDSGVKETLKEEGLSVQAQDKCTLHIAVNQRGEQMINPY